MAEDASLLDLLADGPMGADLVARRAGLRVDRALARLGRLELEGIVRGLPGGRYELRLPFERVGADGVR